MRTTLTASLVLALAGAAHAQTFDPQRVEAMHRFYTANARSTTPLDCLTTLNRGLRVLYDEPTLALSSTVDRSMARLQGMSPPRAEAVLRFEFDTVYSKTLRRPTTGVTRPDALRASVWDAILAHVGEARGYSVFGFSPMDGYHSVLLIADTRAAEPVVYWADQWRQHDGFHPLRSQGALDRKVEQHLREFWLRARRDTGHGFRTQTRLYPLIPTARVTAPAVTAQNGSEGHAGEHTTVAQDAADAETPADAETLATVDTDPETPRAGAAQRLTIAQRVGRALGLIRRNPPSEDAAPQPTQRTHPRRRDRR